MPTVGRTIAKAAGVPLQTIVSKANRTNTLLKNNGALTDLGKSTCKKELAQWGFKSIKEVIEAVGKMASRASETITITIENIKLPH